jgi:hypothetical protein
VHRFPFDATTAERDPLRSILMGLRGLLGLSARREDNGDFDPRGTAYPTLHITVLRSLFNSTPAPPQPDSLSFIGKATVHKQVGLDRFFARLSSFFLPSPAEKREKRRPRAPIGRIPINVHRYIINRART